MARQACKERSFSLLQPSLGNVLEPPKEQEKSRLLEKIPFMFSNSRTVCFYPAPTEPRERS